MIFGLYKHYKGGWYLGICKVWESTNNLKRAEKILYYSFKEKKFNVRLADEFFDTVKYEVFRFTRKFWFSKPCWCREISDTATCPKHGTPTHGNHLKLPRFDGHEHERQGDSIPNKIHEVKYTKDGKIEYKGI